MVEGDVLAVGMALNRAAGDVVYIIDPVKVERVALQNAVSV